MPFELTQDFFDEFQEAVSLRETSRILSLTEGMFAPDISTILDEMNAEDCKYVIEILDKGLSAKIISDLDTDVRQDFLPLFSASQIALILQASKSDDAADILNELSLRFREEILAKLDEETTSNIVELLRYDEDCAGGLMAKEIVKTNIEYTVVQCIEDIRKQAQKIGKFYSVYVVDDDDILLGRVSVKQMLLAEDETKISDIYFDEVISVPVYMDEEEVASIMQKYDLETVPVINMKGKLLGRITIDDALDVITEQAEIDQQVMSGLSENIEADDSVWKLSWARLPWLLIGMMGGLLGAQFIGHFEADLALVPAMAFFIPLITATGGNVGIQSSTIVVQALADNSSLGNPWMRLFKTFSVAIINGIAISVVVFLFNLLFVETSALALVVSIALFSVVMLASLMGTITPLALNRIGINPALASGPFITTANDLLGLAVYFSVARVLLNSL